MQRFIGAWANELTVPRRYCRQNMHRAAQVSPWVSRHQAIQAFEWGYKAYHTSLLMGFSIGSQDEYQQRITKK